MGRTVAILVARLIFAGMFAMAAAFKFSGMADTASYIAAAGFPRVATHQQDIDPTVLCNVITTAREDRRRQLMLRCCDRRYGDRASEDRECQRHRDHREADMTVTTELPGQAERPSRVRR